MKDEDLCTVIRSPMGGPNGRALKAWVKENMPDLDRELGPMSLPNVRVRLNEITGCRVSNTDPVEITCGIFLAALKAQKEDSKDVLRD